MFDFSLLTFLDFILIFVCLSIGTFFIIFGANRLYKIYFGVIIGFLIFLVFNSQIEILEVIYSRKLTGLQLFLVENKDFVLSFFTCFIPILGLFAGLNSNIDLKVKPRLLTTIFFGSFLPFIFIGILAYISENSYVKLDFLRDILSFLQKSYIFFFLEKNTSLVFFAIIFLIFYKIIFTFLINLINYIIDIIKKKEKERKIENEEEYEDEEERENNFRFFS